MNIYPYSKIHLPYGLSELSPVIDEKTLDIHYNTLYDNYINKLNSLLQKYPEYQKFSLSEIIECNCLLPCNIREDAFNLAGGIYNHEFYFTMLCPPKPDNKPVGYLKNAIINSFGSIINYEQEFIKVATEVFGSGYAWLLSNNNGKLYIDKSKNQDTNISIKGLKIFCIDIWEHSYFLQYSANKKSYATNFLNLLDYKKADTLYRSYLNKI